LQKEIKESHARPLVDENDEKCRPTITMTLAEKIYEENRVIIFQSFIFIAFFLSRRHTLIFYLLINQNIHNE
jgi:hypothetical protein